MATAEEVTSEGPQLPRPHPAFRIRIDAQAEGK
jgi:hypothetical protein